MEIAIMSTNSAILLSLVLFYTVIRSADGLQCYECSNLQDKRCGTTFDFAKGSTEAKTKYLKTCDGKVTFCRKLEYEDDFQGKDTNGIVVSRSCWTSPGEEGFEPENECTEMFRGRACYCKSESCNGSELIRASTAVVLLGLLPLLWKLVGF